MYYSENMARENNRKSIGELVKERMAAMGTYAAEVSRATGVPRNVISSVIHNNRGLGPGYAIALGQHLGINPALFDKRHAARAA